MTDLRSISIQYENKINGLYALFVSLERVNMHYIEKMKSRNNNPQTAKQQLKARLQICKNMKQILKNTKKHEDVLTDEQKNLLPNSCNIDPLKPLSKNLTELTNPYFEKPPTKQAKIPDLLTEEKSTLKFKKDKFQRYLHHQTQQYHQRTFHNHPKIQFNLQVKNHLHLHQQY